MEIKYFGIRHHGIGSARNVRKALEDFSPEIILLESPSELEPLFSIVGDKDLEPPVALMSYVVDNPKKSAFYPFATFSPEWQVLLFANQKGISVRCFDLPLQYRLAMDKEILQQTSSEENTEEKEAEDILYNDPFHHFAQIEGYADTESWWDIFIERRTNTEDIFLGIEEAVTELRQVYNNYELPRDLIREAYMRQILRQTEKEGYSKIAVVCGAWHLPALKEKHSQKEDKALYSKLDKVKVATTWIPWTYDRLSLDSGYGAGISAPNFYEHLWENPTDDGVLWLSKVATILRKNGNDVSSASVIEAVRLSQTLAGFRGRSFTLLEDYNEAILATMGFGNEQTLAFVERELIISNKMGRIPDTIDKVPLLSDIEKKLKSLRMTFSAEKKELVLDLRKELDLERSIFIHRLNLLGIDWGHTLSHRSKGTFKEVWELVYSPELLLHIIDKAIYGNVLEEAVVHFVQEKYENNRNIAELSELLTRIVPTDLPILVFFVSKQLESASTTTHSLLELLKSVPNLVSSIRYGSVRNIDYTSLQVFLDILTIRIEHSGIQSCININQDTASELFGAITNADYSYSLLNNEELLSLWNEFLQLLIHTENVHSLLKGYACNLLFQKQYIPNEEVHRLLQYATSSKNQLFDSAFWIEGFLFNLGSVLFLDDTLFRILNSFIISLEEEEFIELLPILRRAFSTFSNSEREKIAEKVKNQKKNTSFTKKILLKIDEEEGKRVIPAFEMLFGI